MSQSNITQLPGLQRVVIEQVSPEIDNGRFAIKRCLNETVHVEASIFADGHDEIHAVLQYRPANSKSWQSIDLVSLGNDRWCGKFTVDTLGIYDYTLCAWVDDFASWHHNLLRWLEAGEDIKIQLLYGAEIVFAASERANNNDRATLRQYAEQLKNNEIDAALEALKEPELFTLIRKYPDLKLVTHYAKHLSVIVDREQARFGSWYELFPRSLGKHNQHGSFKDLIEHLPYVANMGFDILYLPPIHPIGEKFRKGRNNNAIAEANDVGSPWGIGGKDGGHMAIHSQLGTLADFKKLIQAAAQHNLEIALDLALQCSPDHPYVKEHPSWFKKRPDGSIQYAENPPKKYQDIYPLYFQNEHWFELWQEIKKVVLFWIEQGVKIFRVDNPHTKPFVFWEWLIHEIKNDYPEVLFLAEAFTRPHVKYYLAKSGFSQSYTYFTWRNNKQEITHYLSELYSPIAEFFRPNFWVNTPDILHEFLQAGGKAAFIIRVILAATLSGNYGLYGPVFELCINTPVKHGSEEYLDSEKYQLQQWDLQQEHSLQPLLKTINQIRRDNSALQYNRHLHFYHVDNEQLICYGRWDEATNNFILVIVNLDPHHIQSGWVKVKLDHLKISSENFIVADLLDNEQYMWKQGQNFVELNPHKMPAHIFRIEPVLGDERGFKDY